VEHRIYCVKKLEVESIERLNAGSKSLMI